MEPSLPPCLAQPQALYVCVVFFCLFFSRPQTVLAHNPESLSVLRPTYTEREGERASERACKRKTNDIAGAVKFQY